jgi:endoglucanase
MHKSLLACLTVLSVVAPSVTVTSARAQNLQTGQVTVSGKELMRDGKPWIPHGFFQIAFAVPPAAFGKPVHNKPANPAFEIAYNHYSSAEYADMRRAGADSVRMNVAQNGADHDNHLYFNQQWFDTVVSAVKAARAADLSVILSLQNEVQTGSAGSPLPDGETRVVWKKFARLFGQDRGVLFELYNEPNLHPGSSPDAAPSRDDWAQWADAMNDTLKVVRDEGAVNVIVADGLVSAQQLSGAPELKDPHHQVVYASHPYASGKTPAIGEYNQTRDAWEQKFGKFSENHPVIVTEWGVGYFCNQNTPRSVALFLSYLQQHKVGLEAVAWDWGPYNFASAVQGFPKTSLSSLQTPTGANACAAPTYSPGRGTGPETAFGPGKAIACWYQSGKTDCEE